MKVSELLEKKGRHPLIHLSPEDTIDQVIETFNTHNIGLVIILEAESEKLVGILSERDIIKKVLALELDPQKVTTKEIMTQKVATISGEDSLGICFKKFKEIKCRHLPVVNEQQKVVGIISERDIVAMM